MMGGAQGHAPGRVVEFDGALNLVKEYPENPPTDGFNPHGISVRPEINLMVTSDFINPVTTLNAVPGDPELRGSIRVWDFERRTILRTVAIPGAPGTMDVKLIPGDPFGRAYTAARSIGLARGALEYAIAYAKERVQFNRPIAEFQAIRFKIAKMATEVEAARQLLYFVCDEIDKGRRCDTEAAMVKYYAAEMSERVTSEAMQILGGAGYTTLHAVERYWRDARLTRIFDGTSEIQLRIVSDHILGKSEIT